MSYIQKAILYIPENEKSKMYFVFDTRVSQNGNIDFETRNLYKLKKIENENIEESCNNFLSNLEDLKAKYFVSKRGSAIIPSFKIYVNSPIYLETLEQCIKRKSNDVYFEFLNPITLDFIELNEEKEYNKDELIDILKEMEEDE